MEKKTLWTFAFIIGSAISYYIYRKEEVPPVPQTSLPTTITPTTITPTTITPTTIKPTPAKKNKLSGGQIAGIVIGSAIGGGAAIAGGVLLHRRIKKLYKYNPIMRDGDVIELSDLEIENDNENLEIGNVQDKLMNKEDL